MTMAEGMMASIYEYAPRTSRSNGHSRGCRYEEAMDRFGSDKPDLRFGLELKNLTAAFAGTTFKVFADVIARGEAIYGLTLPGASSFRAANSTRLAEIDQERARAWGWHG